MRQVNRKGSHRQGGHLRTYEIVSRLRQVQLSDGSLDRDFQRADNRQYDLVVAVLDHCGGCRTKTIGRPYRPQPAMRIDEEPHQSHVSGSTGSSKSSAMITSPRYWPRTRFSE